MEKVMLVAGSTLGGATIAAVRTMAQDGVTAETGVNFTVVGVGAAVIAWLLRREQVQRQELQAREEAMRRDRREDDEAMRDRVRSLEQQLADERAEVRRLHEQIMHLLTERTSRPDDER